MLFSCIVTRIGQKQQVTFIRYVMKDTIEECIIALLLQQAKSLQAKGAMEKLNTKEKKRKEKKRKEKKRKKLILTNLKVCLYCQKWTAAMD